MKKSNILMAVFCGLFLFYGCEKDVDTSAVKGLKIVAEKYKEDTKTSVDGLEVHWCTDDPVWINGQECHVTVDGSNVSVEDFDYSGYDAPFDIYAYSPYSMTVTDPETNNPTITFPHSFPSSFNGSRQIIELPMAAYTTSESDQLLFLNLSGAVKVRVRNNTANTLYLDTVSVRSSIYQLSGNRAIRFRDGSVVVGAYSTSESEDKAVAVYFESGTVALAPNEIKDVQVPILPTNASGSMTITVKTHNANIVGMPVAPTEGLTHTFSMTFNALAIDRNQLATAQISINPSSHRVSSPYCFSVSAEKKVYFSKGNLTYTPSTTTWAFHDNQWGRCFSSNGVTNYYDAEAASTYTFDLFGWATAGNYISSGRPCYEPWRTRNNSGFYGPNDASTNLNGTNWDWGVNAITNGGNTANQWRTLTQEEWNYLIIGRTNRRMKAKVHNVEGVILFPDVWDNSWYTISSNDTYDAVSNDIWSSLESHGAIFLPAAGYRGLDPDGTGYNTIKKIENVESADARGYYWSSSPSTTANAYGFVFVEDSYNANYTTGRRQGNAVRLVCDAN